MTVGALFTIGYEGRTQDEYLALLRGAGVTLLADVRRSPISRKKGFSKSTLAQGCATVGIRYEHLPELGIASEKRKNVATQAAVDALFADPSPSTERAASCARALEAAGVRADVEARLASLLEQARARLAAVPTSRESRAVFEGAVSALGVRSA